MLMYVYRAQPKHNLAHHKWHACAFCIVRKGILSQLSFTNKVLFPLLEINMKIIVILKELILVTRLIEVTAACLKILSCFKK